MRGNQTEGQTIKQPGIRSVGEWNRRVLDVQREMPSFYRSDRSDKKSLSRSSIRLYDCDRWPLIDSDAACILSAINHSRGWGGDWYGAIVIGFLVALLLVFTTPLLLIHRTLSAGVYKTEIKMNERLEIGSSRSIVWILCRSLKVRLQYDPNSF